MKSLLRSFALLLTLATSTRADSPTNPSPASLCVMTYNLRFASATPPNAWPQRRPLMRELIQQLAPDVMGTQEGVYSQLNDIASDLPEFDWIGIGREGGSRGEFMAVFYRKTRLEPLAYDHFWLSDTPDVMNSTTWGNTYRRMVTWVKFRDRSNGQEFFVFNTHFDHQVQAAREKSAELIRKRVAALNTTLPVLVIGDFNAVAGANKAYDILTAENFLSDAWLVAPEKHGEGVSTFNDFKPVELKGERIDWILTRGEVAVERADISTFGRDGQFPSDHFPVSVRLRVGVATQKATSAPYSHDVSLAEEFRARDGLPNFFAKLQAGGPVRIAYLGGSITEAQGWRPKTLAWFKSQFPKAELVELNAAISGTGSDYGACRLRGDVLTQHPNLVFLECRVNGGGGFEAQSVEGIVRQIWKDNPHTDICFVYTLGQWMLKDLQAGKNTPFGQVMETVANTYGIPSIDLGVETAKRKTEGSLIFQGSKPVEGKLVFSWDGAHPTDAGHELYCEVIARSMLKMKATDSANAHVLPSPLEAANWETASLLPITNAVLSAGWTRVDTSADAVYTDDKKRTDDMLRGAVKCNRAGETITISWNGTTVGMSDIPYGEPPGVVEAVIDGGEPVIMKRTQTEKSHKFARFWYLPEQKPGLHKVTFTTKTNAEGVWFYAGQLLIVGAPIKNK